MYKIQPIRVAYQKPGNLKFCAPININIQKREGLSNFEKPVFHFSVLYQKKEWIKQEIKSVHIRIKQSGLKFPALVKQHIHRIKHKSEKQHYLPHFRTD